jgi:hypothetical protein
MTPAEREAEIDRLVWQIVSDALDAGVVPDEVRDRLQCLLDASIIAAMLDSECVTVEDVTESGSMS